MTGTMGRKAVILGMNRLCPPLPKVGHLCSNPQAGLELTLNNWDLSDQSRCGRAGARRCTSVRIRL